MEIHLKSYDEQFVIQEKSIETAAFERGLEIIKKSMTKFSKYVDRVILKASQDTLRLRKEIEKQETIRVQIEQDIINEEVKNKTLKESLKQQKDPRRNVLKMKEYMTCTPDMDIVLESSTASTNPAVTVQ
jgi:hypothetical protein